MEKVSSVQSKPATRKQLLQWLALAIASCASDEYTPDPPWLKDAKDELARDRRIIQPKTSGVICLKCGVTSETRKSKYCGDGSDKDNEHRWVKANDADAK